VRGQKHWSDKGDWDGIRPYSITVILYANGAEADSKSVSADDGWTYVFEGLDRYDESGSLIVYTIGEEEVDGYESRVRGFDLYNRHEPEKPEPVKPGSPDEPEGTGGGSGGSYGDYDEEFEELWDDAIPLFGGLPQLGLKLWLLYLLMVAGLGSIGGGVLLRRKEEGEDA
jgi:hypothetical protein